MLSVFVENFTNGKACVHEISFFEALAQFCNLCLVPEDKNPHPFSVVNSFFLSLTLFSMLTNCGQVTNLREWGNLYLIKIRAESCFVRDLWFYQTAF